MLNTVLPPYLTDQKSQFET